MLWDLEECRGAATLEAAIFDSRLCGQVIGTVYGRHHPLHCQSCGKISSIGSRHWNLCVCVCVCGAYAISINVNSHQKPARTRVLAPFGDRSMPWCSKPDIINQKLFIVLNWLSTSFVFGSHGCGLRLCVCVCVCVCVCYHSSELNLDKIHNIKDTPT